MCCVDALHVIIPPVPEFGFGAPTFNGTESTEGVAGFVNAEVVITNGARIATGISVAVFCLPTVTIAFTASIGKLSFLSK